ncbi:MAG: formimidoylglutamate deiminase [Candidatus Dormiibacterota bacterium]
MSSWLLELAWTGERLEHRLLLEEVGGRISRLEPLGHEPVPRGARVLPGLTIPGLANAHSHCFHRALRGTTQRPALGRSDFWSWREGMYGLAGRLTPESYFRLARATYGEMALAGITAVGEFHYLHHGEEGTPYAGPAMEEAVIEAAREAGIRLTLLDTCYLRPGFAGGRLEGPAARFSDGDALSWRRRVDRLPEPRGVRLGAAIHSVRALDQEAIRVVGGWARERGAPLHLHLSEQLAENRDCQAATGLSPTELVASLGVLGEQTTAVHGIHLRRHDVELLGRSGTMVCVCPTTERDLADGICPAQELERAGSGLCLGSDSQAVIDLFEEARAVELDQRLRRHRRGLHSPEALLRAATSGGARSLGWDAGELRVGKLADFISLDLESPRLAGAGEEELAARVVYAAHPADVRRVVVGGELVVEEGEHLRLGTVGGLLAQVLEELRL